MRTLPSKARVTLASSPFPTSGGASWHKSRRSPYNTSKSKSVLWNRSIVRAGGMPSVGPGITACLAGVVSSAASSDAPSAGASSSAPRVPSAFRVLDSASIKMSSSRKHQEVARAGRPLQGAQMERASGLGRCSLMRRRVSPGAAPTSAGGVAASMSCVMAPPQGIDVPTPRYEHSAALSATSPGQPSPAAAAVSLPARDP